MTQTYSDWTRARSCDGKVRHRSRQDAKQAARDSADHHGQPRSSWGKYRCGFCRYWYVGHKGVRHG
jgi:hypothetical protein